MIKALKLFCVSVASMRQAQKDYMVYPTPANKSIMVDLQERVDGWVNWIKAQEDAELAKNVPPFINKPQSSQQKELIHNINQQLMANHTPEEIERFIRSMQD